MSRSGRNHIRRRFQRAIKGTVEFQKLNLEERRGTELRDTLLRAHDAASRPTTDFSGNMQDRGKGGDSMALCRYVGSGWPK
jgi:hypothetical protein